MAHQLRPARLLVLSFFVTGIVVCFCALVIMLPAPADAQSSMTAPAQAGPVITIGVAAPTDFFLSQTLGWPAVNAVQLAISQSNAGGGIHMSGITYTLVLTIANDGCNATQ